MRSDWCTRFTGCLLFGRHCWYTSQSCRRRMSNNPRSAGWSVTMQRVDLPPEHDAWPPADGLGPVRWQHRRQYPLFWRSKASLPGEASSLTFGTLTVAKTCADLEPRYLPPSIMLCEIPQPALGKCPSGEECHLPSSRAITQIFRLRKESCRSCGGMGNNIVSATQG